jgi:cellulose biosynthesis protein BcsQ
MNENRLAAGLKEVQPYIVLNRINQSANIAKEIGEALKGYNTPVTNTKLVNRTAYADTASDGLGVVEGKDKKAKEEFNHFTDEIESYISKIKTGI